MRTTVLGIIAVASLMGMRQQAISAPRTKAKCAQAFAQILKTPKVQAQQLRELGYSEEIARRISETRPDVAEAILQLKAGAKNPYAVFAPHELPSGFYREDLEPFYEDRLWAPVKLYRGIDQEKFDPAMRGEKLLVWASEDLKDTLGYAFTDDRSKKVLVLELEVPRFLVYERSDWPVLRLEDVPNVRPFLNRVGVIPLSPSLRRAIETSPGDDKAFSTAVDREIPGFTQGKGAGWKQGKALDALVEKD